MIEFYGNLIIIQIKFREISVKCLGHIFSEKGMVVDPERIKALLEIKSSTIVKELQIVLGTFNSNLNTLLRILLNVLFNGYPSINKFLMKLNIKV